MEQVLDWLDGVDRISAGLLFVCGTLAFLLSTISGGGGSLILVPVLNAWIGAGSTAPVLNLGAFIGRPARLLLFWKNIQWKVAVFYVPSAILGTWLGAYLFSNVRLEVLQVLIGLFLISTIFQYRFGKRAKSFAVSLWYFIPLGFLVAFLGTLIGALGPILNPFYLNLGLDKEDLIATKTFNSFLIGLFQVGSYSFFGLLYGQLWIYGVILGLGAILGNIIGKRFLVTMKSETFRKWLIGIMVISGVMMILKNIL